MNNLRCLFCTNEKVNEDGVLVLEGFTCPIHKVNCFNCGIYAIDDLIFYKLNCNDQDMLQAIKASYKENDIKSINNATRDGKIILFYIDQKDNKQKYIQKIISNFK
jgi:hypothetical protein